MKTANKTLPPDIPEIERRSLYHEAGHAIVATNFDIPFNYVEISKDGRGVVDIACGPLDEPDSCTEKEALQWQQFYAAGAAAETLLWGNHRDYASRVDQNIHARFQAQFLQGHPANWESDIESAMHLLNRDDVELLANALADQRRLTEDQVYKLLGRNPP